MKISSSFDKDGAELAFEASAGQLAHGRHLALSCDRGPADELRIVSPSGEVELRVRIGPDGPQLTVRAVDLELIAEKRLSVQCGQLDLQVAGAATIAAGDVLKLSGLDTHISADRGEIKLRANDDVNVRGERILLNSEAPPLPVDWAEFEARRRGGR